jgi:hypothetical protein
MLPYSNLRRRIMSFTRQLASYNKTSKATPMPPSALAPRGAFLNCETSKIWLVTCEGWHLVTCEGWHLPPHIQRHLCVAEMCFLHEYKTTLYTHSPAGQCVTSQQRKQISPLCGYMKSQLHLTACHKAYNARPDVLLSNGLNGLS